VLYSAIHHCLLQKIRHQKFSAISKKSNVNFFLEVILFISTKGFQTHLGICVNVNVCVFGRTPESRLFGALYMVCPGSAVSWNRQECNRLCNGCKTRGKLGLVCV